MELHFITLKLSKDLSDKRTPLDLLHNRDVCDVFMNSLIDCIERYDLHLYGFVLLSNQVHLIIRKNGMYDEDISQLKNISDKQIIAYLSKKFASAKDVKQRSQQQFRRVVSHLLNSDRESIWQEREIVTELRKANKNIKLQRITSTVLRKHLVDEKRNYMQLGADAFTKLMLDTMKL